MHTSSIGIIAAAIFAPLVLVLCAAFGMGLPPIVARLGWALSITFLVFGVLIFFMTNNPVPKGYFP